MSYTYLLAAGEESSAESFSDIPVSVLSKSNRMLARYSSPDNATESCHASQYGMMSEPSMANRGGESCEPSAAVSRAKTSHVPEQPTATKDSPANEADCGEKWRESYAKWDQLSCSWKTHQCSLLGGLEQFSETWPRWGMMLRGAACLLRPVVPPISESDFGYLPTPDASLGMFDATAKMDMVTCFNKETVGHRKSGAKIGSSLRWHPDFIHEWQRTGGELNAEWIEALMGWPIGWTACTPLEMDKFQSWQQWHGEYLRLN